MRVSSLVGNNASETTIPLRARPTAPIPSAAPSNPGLTNASPINAAATLSTTAGSAVKIPSIVANIGAAAVSAAPTAVIAGVVSDMAYPNPTAARATPSITPINIPN